VLIFRPKIHAFLLTLVALPALAGPEPATITQTEAQELAARANAAGADQSLQASTTKAMQALIQFSDSDIPGAVKSAYRAYGSFKTGEDLDRVRKRNILTKAGLSSAGVVNVSEEDAIFLASRTSYRRLDPAFLNKGEAAKIAEEFEKKTGIKRKDFLEQLASASEAKLFVSDPKLAEKVSADFTAFVDRIPNAEFKAKVKSATALIPDLTKSQLLMTAVQKAVQLASKTMPSESDLKLAENVQLGTTPVKAAIAEAPREPAAAGVAQVAETAPAPDAEEIAPTVDLTSDQMARSFRRETGDPFMGSVVRAAVGEARDDETIFKIVSRRYRAVTPRMQRN
jgi:hypothetical protein